MTMNFTCRAKHDDRESWLAGRARGIGGSEAAAAIGMSPWQTTLDLWRLKTGRTAPKDLSGDAFVQQGVKMEPLLRDFFTALHPEYTIEHHPYDMIYQTDRPWLFATLDGEMTTEDGKHGIVEIKTSTPGAKWQEWSDGKMPMHYYVQVLHQLLATGYDFAILFACLYGKDGSMTMKEYEIDRTEVQDDLDWLMQEEEIFWRHVEDGTMPPQKLVI